jgi:hypothetical protein
VGKNEFDRLGWNGGFLRIFFDFLVILPKFYGNFGIMTAIFWGKLAVR